MVEVEQQQVGGGPKSGYTEKNKHNPNPKHCVGVD